MSVGRSKVRRVGHDLRRFCQCLRLYCIEQSTPTPGTHCFPRSLKTQDFGLVILRSVCTGFAESASRGLFPLNQESVT
jgi:hypothetical protein